MEKKYLAHLTGFRAIAAYLVLITHGIQSAFRYEAISPHPTIYVTCVANLGMSIFFVMSGFVITYTYYDHFARHPWLRSTREFAIARFARLYPLYIFCIICNKHDRGLLFHHSALWVKIGYLTLTQSWWHYELYAFIDTWSISTECFFYVIFCIWMLPLIRHYSKMYTERKSATALIGIYIILATIFVRQNEITVFLNNLLTDPQRSWSWWLEYASPYIRIGEFIAGCYAARMFMAKKPSAYSAPRQLRANILLVACCMAIFALTLYNCICGIEMSDPTGWVTPDNFILFLSLNFGYAPFLAYIFYACSKYPNPIARWCSTPLMQKGGEISYSLYLLQSFVINNIFQEAVAEKPSYWAYIVSLLELFVYVALTTIVAFLSYRLIEVPSRRLIRKFLLPAGLQGT